MSALGCLDSDGVVRLSKTHALALGAALALESMSVLHVMWGAGQSWPMHDREALADTVVGTPEVPSPLACFIVGAALTGAAALVAGAGGQRRPARAARVGIVVAMFGRGVTGITGLTGLLVPWTPSDTFVAVDKRRYGPLCLGIAALAAASLARPCTLSPLVTSKRNSS